MTIVQKLTAAGVIAAALAAGVAGVAAQPSDPVGGPALGFSPNADGSIVWPILGIPGASVIGRRLTLGEPFSGAVVSPRQDYLVAIRSEDAQPVISRLTTVPMETVAINGARPGAAMIAISPGGATVALYSHESKILQVLRGFPAAPELAFEMEITPGASRVSAFAVSDDASVALLGIAGEGGDSLWALRPSGAQYVSSTHASSVAFIVNRHDAVVADNLAGESFLLSDTNYTAARALLVSRADGVDGVAGVAVSDNGRFAVVAGAATGTIGIFDMEKSQLTVVRCNCIPSGVYRMTGTAVFRLTEPPDGLTTILDMSTGKARILVTPPEPKTDSANGVTR